MLKARDYFPAVKHGAKWLAEDLAGVIGQPHVGNIYYVDANSGSDTANSGTDWDDAFATLSKAEDTATSNNYDVIIVAPNGTSGTAETSAITWDKNHITVIGASAPTMISQRSRVVFTSDSLDPCLTISGAGNRFINLQIATYQDSNDVLVSISGSRNYFDTVHFAGMGTATAGDDATGRIVAFEGGSENTFANCVFGLDTVLRSAANATLEFDGGAARNIFNGCLFNAAIDAATPVHVLQADASGSDRFQWFNRCGFIAFSTNEGTAQSAVFSIPASPQTNRYILQDCWEIGATTYDANTRGDVFANMPAAAASAAGGSMTSQ